MLHFECRNLGKFFLGVKSPVFCTRVYCKHMFFPKEGPFLDHDTGCLG